MLSGQGIQISDLSICIDRYFSLSSLGLQSQVAKTHEEGIQAENLDGCDSFSQVEKVGKETLQKYCHFITCKLYPRKYEIHLKISDVQREWVNNFWPFRNILLEGVGWSGVSPILISSTLLVMLPQITCTELHLA